VTLPIQKQACESSYLYLISAPGCCKPSLPSSLSKTASANYNSLLSLPGKAVLENGSAWYFTMFLGLYQPSLSERHPGGVQIGCRITSVPHTASLQCPPPLSSLAVARCIPSLAPVIPQSLEACHTRDTQLVFMGLGSLAVQSKVVCFFHEEELKQHYRR